MNTPWAQPRDWVQRALTGATVLVLAVIALVSCNRREAPVAFAPAPEATAVTLRQGAVTGTVATPGAFAWLGIPYAAPPVGERRWRAPRPASPWRTTLAAEAHGPVCPQTASPLGGAPADLYGKLWGQEDCLTLNVYAPADAPRGAQLEAGEVGLPVLVWIHGGGNVVGHSGFYNGARLATEQQLVVVTFNYRLGPLGWFYHPSLAGEQVGDGSGNYGTLDMIAVLRWVQAQIRAFGGDPARVTVAGQSAGGRNVFALLVSPLAEGLFQRAIIQSGGTYTATVAEASHYRDDATAPGSEGSGAEIVLAMLGGERSQAKARANAMAAADVAARLRALDVASLFALYDASPYSLGAQGPTLIRDGRVLPDVPTLELLSSARWHQMPVLLGSTRDEAKLFMAFEPDQVMQVAGLPLWRKHGEAYDREARYRSLAWKYYGVDRPAQALLKGGAPALYTYRWDWDEEGRFGFTDLSAIVGAGHGLEIPFIFGHFDVGPKTRMLYHDRNEVGRVALTRAMMGYWGAFVRDGAPGSGGTGAPQWPPYGIDAPNLMLLDTQADGGVRLSDERVSKTSILAELSADEALEGDVRCRLYDITLAFDAFEPTDRSALGCDGVPVYSVFGEED